MRVAVFMDGCFWHGCPEHHSVAKANADFWAANIDELVNVMPKLIGCLPQLDWLALRYWEHVAPEEAARDIAAKVRDRAFKMRSPRSPHPSRRYRDLLLVRAND